MIKGFCPHDCLESPGRVLDGGAHEHQVFFDFLFAEAIRSDKYFADSHTQDTKGG